MTPLDRATIAVTAANANWKNQTVFIGDNCEVMLGINSNSADLICDAPPFNKEKQFNHLFGTAAKTKPGGRIGFVLPLTAAFAEAWSCTRQMIEEDFEDIVAVVSSEGSLSADTGMQRC